MSLTVLRPVVAGAVVDWATDNPSALHLPFVQDLVREDLGKAMTDAPSTEAGQAEFVVADGDTASQIATRLADQGFLLDASSVRLHLLRARIWPTSSRRGPICCAGT